MFFDMLRYDFLIQSRVTSNMHMDISQIESFIWAKDQDPIAKLAATNLSLHHLQLTKPKQSQLNIKTLGFLGLGWAAQVQALWRVLQTLSMPPGLEMGQAW